MSNGKGENFIEGRWEDIVADPHRFDGKTVRVSVVEDGASQRLPAADSHEEWAAYFQSLRDLVTSEETKIPSKAERREIITQILEEKARRKGWFK